MTMSSCFAMFLTIVFNMTVFNNKPKPVNREKQGKKKAGEAFQWKCKQATSTCLTTYSLPPVQAGARSVVWENLSSSFRKKNNFTSENKKQFFLAHQLQSIKVLLPKMLVLT